MLFDTANFGKQSVGIRRHKSLAKVFNQCCVFPANDVWSKIRFGWGGWEPNWIPLSPLLSIIHNALLINYPQPRSASPALVQIAPVTYHMSACHRALTMSLPFFASVCKSKSTTAPG
ncbi:hypothetical protein LIA77_02151 [Sarocladium implicatum]|nr:hypothetical protein LIA77_02151 [Sarocladium implicatum]